MPGATATPASTDNAIQTFYIKKETRIAAPADIVFETLLEPHGPLKEMKLKVEPFPGGRWFRDLGNNTGHLWGHVQVIKPPTLLELIGPMMMSYPAISHLQYRLTQDGDATLLTLIHRVMGLLSPEHSSGFDEGWEKVLEGLRSSAEERIKK